MFIIISILLIAGLLSSYIAKKKHRNPIAWFFISFFLLGIFALLLLAFLPSKQIREQKVALSNANEPLNPSSDEFEEFSGKINQEKILRISTSKTLDWYLIDGKGIRAGPMNYAAMRLFVREQPKPNETYVWNTELEDWKQLKVFINVEILFDKDFD